MSVRSHKTRSIRVEKAKKQAKHNKKLMAQITAARIRKTNIDFEKNLHTHQTNLARYADMCKMMEAECGDSLGVEEAEAMKRVKTTITTFTNLLQKIELMRAGVAMQGDTASMISEDDAHEFTSTMMELHSSIIADFSFIAKGIDLIKSVDKILQKNPESTTTANDSTATTTDTTILTPEAIMNTTFDHIPVLEDEEELAEQK